MGGSVVVVVRESNHKVTTMCRHTNALPGLVQSLEFLNNTDAVLAKYIEERHQSDYHQEGENFAPGGYGLVVIDAVNKLILSHQNYCDFASISGAHFSLSLNLHSKLDWSLMDSEVPFVKMPSDEEDRLEAKKEYELFMDGRIKGHPIILSPLTSSEKKTKRWKAYQEMSERLAPKNKTVADWEFFLRYIRGDNFSHFSVDLNPWSVLDYQRLKIEPTGESDDSVDENKVQFQAFKEKLISLGFVLYDNDLAAWDDFLRE